jgi:hypothetical protein
MARAQAAIVPATKASVRIVDRLHIHADGAWRVLRQELPRLEVCVPSHHLRILSPALAGLECTATKLPLELSLQALVRGIGSAQVSVAQICAGHPKAVGGQGNGKL